MRAPIVLATFLAVLLFTPWAQAQDSRLAVDEFAARLGEITVTDLVVTQGLTLHDSKDSRRQVTGQQRLAIKPTARQRVETDMGGEREVRVLNSVRLVVEGGGRVFEAPPLERARQRAHTLFPFRRTAADLLLEWRSLGVRTEVAETARAGGRAVTVIGAREGDRTSPAVWLDPEHGVIRFIAREEGPNGVKLMDLAFSEHRKVSAGFFYPFRQGIFLDGELLSVTSVPSVEVNAGLSDSPFDPDALLKGASQ